MARLFGISGKATGRKGDAVFAVNGGQQMLRQYNPIVNNPATAKQVESRAKMKLMTQLAAVCANIIAIPASGNKSSRNLFYKKNYNLTTFADGEARINLKRIQLTNSAAAMVNFNVNRAGGANIACALDVDGSEMFSRVVYVAIATASDGKMRVLGSVVAETPGNDGLFEAALPYTAESVVVLAYGINVKSGKATAKLDNINGEPATHIAKLFTSRQLASYDAALTETMGCAMAVGETSADTDDIERLVCAVNVTGSGTTTGAGSYVEGSQVTLVATPASGAQFNGWYENNVLVSSNSTLSFTITSDRTFEARFSALPPVTISVGASPVGGGSVSGGGSVAAGANCTVVAVANNGYRFNGWYENNVQVSSDASYTFVANTNRTLEARFAEAGQTINLIKRAGCIEDDGMGGTEWTHQSTDDNAVTAVPSLPADVEIGSTVQLTADASLRAKQFAGWVANNAGDVDPETVSFISTERSYTYTVQANKRYIVAVYR